MKAKHFVLLAIAALVSTLVAVASWTLREQWSQGTIAGTRLFPSLPADAARIAAIQVRQGGATVTLEKKGQSWGVKERAGYPADGEKVRTLLIRLSEAELLEPKTRTVDKYGLLELEDPAGKDAKSRSVKLLDSVGASFGEVVIGKRRIDALGSGKGATYVRKPGDAQTWLASGELDAPSSVRDWVKPQAFETDSSKIDKLSLEVEGEEPLKAERGKEKVEFAGFPVEGKKLKDSWAADSLIRSASSYDLEDVRKSTGAGKEAAKVTIEGAGGLKVMHVLRKDGDAYWISTTATGEGDAKKPADELNARTAGWEFKISNSKAETLIKKRSDLLDEKAS